MRLKSNSKKAMLDIPLQIVSKMLIGMLTAILIIIPLMNLFFVEDFNKEVAKDTMSSLNDFFEFKVENYGGVDSRSKCVDIFKIEHLSDSQVLNSKFDNYVIVITTDFIGLITYNEFDKLKSEQISANDIKITNVIELDLDRDIELDFFSYTEGFNNENGKVQLVFLVPSIVLESTLITSFTGASKSGYYVYYVTDKKTESGKLSLLPYDSTYTDLLQYTYLSDDSSGLKNLHLGFVRDNTLKFGVIEKHPTDYNPLGSCRYKPKEITTGDSANPLLNLEGTTCNVDININQETVHTFRNRVYWDNFDGVGFKCNSNYNGLPDFCQSFVENHNEFFTSTIERNSDNLNLVSDKFKEFVQYFYNRDDLDYEIEGVYLSSGNLEYEIKGCKISDKVIVESNFNFHEFFEKVEGRVLAEYIISKKLEDAENIFFPIQRTVEYCDFDKDYSHLGLNYNICSYVISYQEGSEKYFIYYIDTQDSKLKGFYKFKNLNDLSYFVDEESSKFTINLGGRFLPYSYLEKTDDTCGWIKWMNLFNNCDYEKMFQIDFKDNIFDDIATPGFSIFAYQNDMQKTNVLRNDFSVYFKEIGDEFKSGENNPSFEYESKNYVLNANALNDITIEKFFPSSFKSGERIHFQFAINGEFMDVALLLNKDGTTDIFEQSNDGVVFPFEQFEENPYPLTFEQLVFSMYNNGAELDSNIIKNSLFDSNGNLIIENLELRVEEISNGDSTNAGRVYVLYLKDIGQPLFYRKKDSDVARLFQITNSLDDDFHLELERFISLNNCNLKEFNNNFQMCSSFIIPFSLEGELNFKSFYFELSLQELKEISKNLN